MKIRNNLGCAEIKSLDIVDYLTNLGFQPVKIRQHNYWYCSPLRTEKTPSFKVNRKINKWYDFGEGAGGNLVDFAVRYHNCSIRELLQSFNSDFSLHQQPIVNNQHTVNEEGRIKVLKDTTLLSFALCRYLRQRRIPLQIADAYCREIRYEMHGKEYFAIGFLNDAGGYELRNPFFKGSCSPKEIRTLQYGANEVSVFEGFFDFLTFLSINQNQSLPTSDFIILNSVSFFEKSRLVMEQYERVHLYLDNDTTGQNCTHYALSLDKRYCNESGLYQNHKDLNDWAMNIGKSSIDDM